MKKNRKLICWLLVMTMVAALLSGCGSTAAESTAPVESSAESVAAAPAEEAPAEETPAEEMPAEEAPAEEAPVEEVPAEEAVLDLTESNANMDFGPWQEMLKGLTTELPIVEEPETLTYFFGFESASLNYIPGGELKNHQIWSNLENITGVHLDITVVDGTTASDKTNLMIASGDYTDLMNMASYTAGVDAAYEEEIIIDLEEYLAEYMPNYWTIINADQKLLGEVKDSGKFLAIYPIKDEVANPTDMGTFIRMDWLDDLGMEVPTTYDELTAVLEAFKSEKNCVEPLALYNTISMNNGLLSGGFGSMAELSTNSMDSNALNAYYQVDGEVVYGATADGTRKFLSWLNELYEKDLIHFENMQNRYVNPFGELTAIAAADGTNGVMFSNQPFGGNYSVMAANDYGDPDCNWWPVQDVAETSGQTIPFFQEVSLVDSISTVLCVSSQCENVETALKFIDFGYSYEGSLLYNFGYQKGSGHEVESWDFNEEGRPEFDPAVFEPYGATAVGSAVLCTKDLSGVIVDTRLAFEFGERENACFGAWSTNRNNSQILGSATQFTSEEGQEAAGIYSDILTYVATSVLEFINGTKDIDDDTVWQTYVSDIEGMNLAGLTEIVQGAYDRANP